jgi:hypothetical protein
MDTKQFSWWRQKFTALVNESVLNAPLELWAVVRLLTLALAKPEHNREHREVSNS